MESAERIKLLADTINFFEIPFLITDVNLNIQYYNLKNVYDIIPAELKFKNIKDFIKIVNNNTELDFDLSKIENSAYSFRLFNSEQEYDISYNHIYFDDDYNFYLFIIQKKNDDKEKQKYARIIKNYINFIVETFNVLNKNLFKIDHENFFESLYSCLKKYLKHTTFLINEYNSKEKRFYTRFIYSPLNQVKEIFAPYNKTNPFYFVISDNIYKKKLKPRFTKLEVYDFFEIYTPISTEKIFEYLTLIPIQEILSFGFIQENLLVATITLFIHSKEENLFMLENLLRQFNLILQRDYLFKDILETKNMLTSVLNHVTEGILILDENFNSVFENKNFLTFLNNNYKAEKNPLETFINTNKLLINKSISGNIIVEETNEFNNLNKYFIKIIPVKQFGKNYVILKVEENLEVKQNLFSLESVFKDYSDGVVFVNKELKVVMYNNAFLRIFEINKNVNNQYLFSIINIYSDENLEILFKKLMKEKIVFSKKISFKNKIGQEKKMLKTVIPLENVDTCFMIIFKEIDEKTCVNIDTQEFKEYKLKLLPYITKRVKTEIENFTENFNINDFVKSKKYSVFNKYLEILHLLLSTEKPLIVNKDIVFIYNLFVNEIEQYFKKEPKNSELIFSFENTPSENYPVITNELILKKIIKILLENSITRTKNGTIRLKYTLDNNYLNIFLSDTGRIINYKEVRLFLKNSNIQEMYINDEVLDYLYIEILLKTLGGEFKVEGELKENSIAVHIPVNKIEESFEKIQEIKTTEINLKNVKILICDDDEFNYIFIRELLTEHGAEIYYAPNGNEALKKISETEFNLILMDVRLPDIDGLNVIKKIKTFSPNIPIIIQTAYNIALNKDEIPAEDVIYKPIDYNLLFYKINNLLNKS
ncbi:MAG: response regulator [Bacteroidales bacterium]|nr:response regulator [Bacteroidales bacterium]